MRVFQIAVRLTACAALASVAAFIIRILVRLIRELASAKPPDSCDYLCDLIAAVSSTTCMECEMAAFRSLWVWIAVLGLLIVGLAFAVVRCVMKTFRGDRKGENNEEEPAVAINGPGSIVLVREEDVFGSPTATYTAVGTPSGGSCRWSVVEGEAKVQLLTGTEDAVLSLKPLVASEAPGDVRLRVEYSTGEGTAQAHVDVTIHKATTSVRVGVHSTHTFNGPTQWGWEVMYRYQVLDQFGSPYPEQIVRLEEQLTPIHNPFYTTFVSQNFITDANAQYVDQYELTFQNQPVPSNYIARVRQVVTAEGWVVLDHTIEYGSTGVSFTP